MSPPFFEYLCDEGHEVELEQNIKADPLTKCYFRVTVNAEEMEGVEGYGVPIKQRVCGAPCRRQISQTSFKFKGGPPTPKYHQ